MASRSIKINTLLVTLALILSTEFIGWVAIHKTNMSALPVIGCIRMVQIAAMAFIVVRLEGGLTAVGWAPVSWIEGWKKGAIWSMAFGAATAVAMAGIYFSGHNPLHIVRSPLPSNQWDLALLFVIGGIVAPVAEELCFRGIVYSFFRRWGIMVALIASTTLFVLLHTFHGLPVTQIVGGLVFAIAYEVTENLMVPITIHCIGNTAIFALSLL